MNTQQGAGSTCGSPGEASVLSFPQSDFAEEKMSGKSGRKGTSTSNEGPPVLQGVDRALKVLDAVADYPMRISDLSAELKISWATLQRTLSQLETAGFVERDDAGLYKIGRKMWLLGSTYLVGNRVLELARPLLAQAASELPNAVLQLVERIDGTSVVLLSQDAASAEDITRATYGYHFPLHCGSKGLVLLAHENEDFIDEYLEQPRISLTSETVTDATRIRDELERVRTEGYAITRGDVQTFTGSISAPIFDANGAARGCVCAVARRTWLTGEREDRTLEVVLRLANALSLGLGWQALGHAKTRLAESPAQSTDSNKSDGFGSSARRSTNET